MKKLILFLLLITAIHQTLPAQERARWRQVFPKNVPPARSSFGMAKLTEGKVLMFGGEKENGEYTNETWLFEFNNMEWTKLNTNHLPKPRAGHQIAQISDGKVLLYGGYGFDNSYVDTWLFDLNTMDWQNLNTKDSCGFRTDFKMCNLSEGTVFIFSNESYYNIITNEYNLNTNIWHQIEYADKPNSRIGCGMASLDSNLIIFYGGKDLEISKTTELYNYKTRNWIEIFPKTIPKTRYNFGFVDLTKNKVIAFGGNTRGSDTGNVSERNNDTWIFDLKDSNWNELKFDIKPKGRINQMLANITNNKILLYGGNNKFGAILYDTWIFDLDSLETNIDQTNNNTTNLYPNPANEYINITNDNIIKSYSIFNIIGELEETKEVNSNSININTNTLPTGIYSIKLNYDNTSEIKKIIINR